jgi:hypothetical protein
VLYLPREFVWKEEVCVPFELRKVDLRRAVTLDANHHLSKAKRLWLREGAACRHMRQSFQASNPNADLYAHYYAFQAGDMKRGKKNILHGLRTLHYALQLLRKGAITDIQEVNHYWSEVSSFQ